MTQSFLLGMGWGIFSGIVVTILYGVLRGWWDEEDKIKIKKPPTIEEAEEALRKFADVYAELVEWERKYR